MLSIFERQLRPGLVITVILSLMLATLCSITWAGSGESSSPGVSIDLDGVTLDQVIKVLSLQADVKLMQVTTPEESQKRVNAHYKNAQVEDILNDLLMASGINYRKTESGTYLIGSGVPTTERDANPGSEVASGLAPRVESIPVEQPKRKTRTEYIKLKQWAPSDMVFTLLDETAFNRAAMTRWVDPREPRTPTENNDNGIMMKNPNAAQPAYDPATTDPAPPMEDIHDYANGELHSAERAKSSFGTAEQTPYTPYSRSTGTTNPYTPARTGATGSRTNTTTPGGTTGSTSGNNLLPEGIESIKAIDVDNSIIVRGDDDGIAELKDLIHMLDVAPKQVQIKAEFIEVSANIANRLGIDWNLDSLNKSFSTSFLPAGNVVLGIASGNVTATLRTELTSGKGKIINAPIISTINNMGAQISIGQEIPIFLTNLVSTGQGNVVSGTTVGSRPVNTGLSVLPRINGDNSVTMYLQPQVSDTGKIYKGPDGTEVPETRFQTLTTNRRVKNGETIVIGGFVRRSDSMSLNEVPLLSRIPFIGNLFKSRSRDAEDRELLIFLTPTIIEDDSSGSSSGIRTQL